MIASTFAFAGSDFTLLPVVLALFAFYFWMLIDCIMKEPAGNQRVVWLDIILFIPLGFAVYFFARKLCRSGC